MVDIGSQSTTRQVRAVYARVYGRSDLGRPAWGWKIGLGVLAVWTLVGLVNICLGAPTHGKHGQRIFHALAFGPLFFPLHVAQADRTITIGPARVPVGLAALVGILPVVVAGVCTVVGQDTRDRQARQRRAAREHALGQGRQEPRDVRNHLGLTGPGVPLALIAGQPIGIPQGQDAGHIAVVAPTRSGKGLHLTATLLQWAGPAVVLDPKGEQWERTAGERQGRVGPVYTLPRDGLDLLDSYDLSMALDLKELHTHLLRSDRDKEPIFAEKSLAIFQAAAITGRATGEHPLRLLARWAELPSPDALTAAAICASAEVARFTDGSAPHEVSRPEPYVHRSPV